MPSISVDAKDRRLTPARADLAAEHLRGSVEAERYAPGAPHSVRVKRLALKAGPNPADSQVSELLYGETFVVYEMRDGWAWGQAEADGYVGYAHSDGLKKGATQAGHVVATCFAHLYPEPALKCPAAASLPLGSRLALDAESPCGRYRRLADSSLWISSRQVIAMDARAADPMAVAELFLGSPYLWGGKTAAGLDCSALIQIPLFMAGIDIPRDSDLQRTAMADGLGRLVSRRHARRGDIAFFPGHVGFLADRDRLLHANATRMAVTTDPLEDVRAWVARDHPQPFLEIYRLDRSAA